MPETNTNPDLQYALEIFARPLPQSELEYEENSFVLTEKRLALNNFYNHLADGASAVSDKLVKAAIACTLQIMTAEYGVDDTSKKDAVSRFTELLSLRPFAFTPESLDTVFETIRFGAAGPNHTKWMGRDSELTEILRDLGESIAQSDLTSAGGTIETSSSLSALVFKGMIHEIAGRKFANLDATGKYIDLVAVDDARIDIKNLTIVRDVIDREIKGAEFTDNQDLQALWNDLAEKFSTALEMKFSMTNPRLVEDITNLAYVLAHTPTHDPVALHALQEGYRLADQNVGVAGELRYQRIPFEALAELHNAAAEHLDNQPVSNLAEMLWHRVNFGGPKQPAV